MAVAAAGAVAVAIRAGRGSLSSFLLADRGVPVWAAAAAFLSAETTAVTLIALPALAYREDLRYLQVLAGAAAARLAVAALFLPAFYKHEVATPYEYLGLRFGPWTRGAAAIFFLAARLAISAVRLMASAAVVAVLLDWPLVPVLLIFTAAGIASSVAGGARSAAWSGVLQSAVILIAVLAGAAFLTHGVKGGVAEILRLAGAAGRLGVAHRIPADVSAGWAAYLRDPDLLWAAVITGFFGSLAACGVDHEMTQKLLLLKTRGQAQRALLLATTGWLLLAAALLPVGTALFAFYEQHPELALPRALDNIYPHFALQVLPAGLRGWTAAAVLLASIDVPLAALGSAFVNDLYRPLFPYAEKGRCLAAARAFAAASGIVLGLAAYLLSRHEGALLFVFKAGGAVYGPLLGIFLLGLATRRGADAANAAAMVLTTGACLVLLMLSEGGLSPLGWHWLVVVGAAGSAALAAPFSSPDKGGASRPTGPI